MNDRREMCGSTMVDWASSAAVTTFLGPFLQFLAERQGDTNLLDLTVRPA